MDGLTRRRLEGYHPRVDDVSAFYAQPSYARGMLEFWNGTSVEIYRRLSLHPPLRLLDIGSGSGALVEQAHLDGLDAHGVEPYWPIKSERITHAFGEALPFPDASFDVVTSISVLVSATDPIRSLTEMSRVLRAGGRAYIAIPELSSYPFLRLHGIRHVTSRAWLRQRLGPEWTEIDVWPFGLRFAVPVLRRMRLIGLLRALYWHRYPWAYADLSIFVLAKGHSQPGSDVQSRRISSLTASTSSSLKSG